jgi:hypothetical protein
VADLTRIGGRLTLEEEAAVKEGTVGKRGSFKWAA